VSGHLCDWWGDAEARLRESDAFWRDTGRTFTKTLAADDEMVFWRAFLEGLLYGPAFAVDPRPWNRPR